MDQPLVSRLTLPAPATYRFRISDGGHGFGEYGNSYEYNNQESVLPYHVTWNESATAAGEGVATAGVPVSDFATATQARPLALPASVAFFLYPAGDREFLDLGECGPGLLEFTVTARAGTLNPVVGIMADGPATGPAELARVDHLPGPVETGRVVLPRRARHFAVVTAAGDAGSPLPLQAEVRCHVFPSPRGDLPEEALKDGASLTLPVTPLGTPLSAPLFPAGDRAAFLLDFPAKGLLRLEGGAPSGLDLTLGCARHVPRPLRVLYLVGGRRDYNLFPAANEQVVVTRLHEDSPGWLAGFLQIGTRPVGDWPPTQGATWSARLDLPAATTFGRLLVRGFSFAPGQVRVRLNGQEAGGSTPVSQWNEWSEHAWPVPDLAAGASLQVEMQCPDHALLGRISFEAWTGTQTLSIPLPPFREDPWPASLTAGFDAIVLDGVTHPCQFFLDRPAVQRRLVAEAERGARVVVTTPQFFSFAANARQVGGWIATASPAVTDPNALIDGSFPPEGNGGCHVGAAPPQTVVFGLPGSWPAVIDRLVIHPATTDPAGQVRGFRLEASLDGPTTGFRTVGEFAVETGARLADTAFPPTPARFLRLTVLASSGNRHACLGDCEFYGPAVPRGWFGVYQQSQWRNDSVVPVRDDEALVGGRARGDPNRWPASDLCGCFVG